MSRLQIIVNFILLMIILFMSEGVKASDNEQKPLRKYDVLGVGVAMLDLKMHISFDNFKKTLFLPYNVQKGSKVFINLATSKKLGEKLEDYEFSINGDIPNILTSLVSLGGKAGYNTNVGNDDLGNMFKNKMLTRGIIDLIEVKKGYNTTAHNFIYITPDLDQTTLTFNGQTKPIGQVDVKYHSIKDYKLLLLDSAIWDHDQAGSKAIIRSLNFATKVGVKKGLWLNDNQQIIEYRNDFINLLPKLDILFCNEKQALELFASDNIREVINRLQKTTNMALIMQADKGALLITPSQIKNIASPIKSKKKSVNPILNHASIAGFIYGYINNYSLNQMIDLANKTSHDQLNLEFNMTEDNLKITVQ